MIKNKKVLLLINYIFLDYHMCKSSRIGLLNALSNFGYDVIFFGAYIKLPEKENGIKLIQYKVHRLSYIKLIWFIILANIQLPRIAIKNKVQYIMCDPYSIPSLFSIYFYNILFGKRIKIILDFRSGIFYSRGKILKDFIKDIFIRFVINVSKIICNGYTFITPELKKIITSKFNLKSIKYTYWSSAVDNRFIHYRSKKVNISNGDLKILFHGALSREKGLNELFHAMRNLEIKKYPVILSIVGDGEIKNELIELAQKNHMNNIHFYNNVNQSKIMEFIDECDLGIIPLADTVANRTSSSLKMMEYLALNKPVIVTDITAFKNSKFRNCNSLIFIKNNEPKNIEKSIIYAYQNKKILPKLGANGRNIIKDHFLWEHQANKVISLFNIL